MWINLPTFVLFFPDVDVDKPDEKSIMTYVAQFLKQYPDIHSTGADGLGSDVSIRWPSSIDSHSMTVTQVFKHAVSEN